MPNLVPAQDVAWANSTIAIGRNAGALLGPMLGGAVAGLLAPSVVFAADAVCFAGSAAMVASVHGRFADPQRNDAEEHEGLRAGFRLILADPVLRLITLAWIVLLFLLGPVLVAELPAGALVRRGRRRLRHPGGVLGRRRDRRVVPRPPARRLA